MTLQTIPGGMYIPQIPIIGQDGGSSLNSVLINAASEKAAGIFQAPKTGTIDKVGFRTGAVTVGDTVDVRLETVSATNGDPTGTLLGTNSNGAQVIANDDDTTWFLTALTTGVAVTKGDVFAVVIVNGGSGGDMGISELGHAKSHGFPYGSHFTSSWAKQSDIPLFLFEYSDTTYAVSPGAFPFSAGIDRTFNSADTPDERALYFQLPFPFRVAGYWIEIDLDGDCDIVLYDADGTTVLQTDSLDKDIRMKNAKRIHQRIFSSTSDLLANTNYRLSCKPGASDVIFRDYTVDNANFLNALSGGPNFHYSTRADAGSWTESTVIRPNIGILIDGFGGGGHPGAGIGGMTGGMQ